MSRELTLTRKCLTWLVFFPWNTQKIHSNQLTFFIPESIINLDVQLCKMALPVSLFSELEIDIHVHVNESLSQCNVCHDSCTIEQLNLTYGQVQKKWPQTVFAIKKRGKWVYNVSRNEVQGYLFFTPMSRSGAIFFALARMCSMHQWWDDSGTFYCDSSADSEYLDLNPNPAIGGATVVVVCQASQIFFVPRPSLHEEGGLLNLPSSVLPSIRTPK